MFQEKFQHTTHTFHVLTVGVPMDNTLGLSCQICKELSPSFAYSCELKQMAVWWCVLDKPGLYATPIV